MTDVWTWPARIGVLFGVALFVTLLVPILAIQVRRYGAINLVRLIGAAALAVYGMALAAYTLLPLPSGDLAAWCAQYGYEGAQLRPGQIFADIRDRTAGLSLGATVRDISVLQGVFNVVLFVPWGILVRRYLGWGLPASAVSALGASLLIETIQLTGIFGLIPCSYRLADVDDLVLNTAGGVLGALIGPWVLRWMPGARTLAATRGVPRPVTVWRRWLGMAVDAAAYGGLSFVLATTWGLAVSLTTGRAAPDTAASWLVTSVLPWLVVFLYPLLTGAGESLGQRTVWLAVVPDGDGAGLSARARVRRGLAGGALWGLLQVLADASTTLDVGVLTGANALGFVMGAVLVVAVPFSVGKRGLSGRVARYRLADARQPELRPSRPSR